MDTKQKFLDIKLHKLPKITRDKLISIEKATRGFTVEVPKAELYITAVYTKISINKPELLFSCNNLKNHSHKEYQQLMSEMSSLESKMMLISQDLQNIRRKLSLLSPIIEPNNKV